MRIWCFACVVHGDRHFVWPVMFLNTLLAALVNFSSIFIYSFEHIDGPLNEDRDIYFAFIYDKCITRLAIIQSIPTHALGG